MTREPLTVPRGGTFSYRELTWMDSAACRYLGMHAPDDVILDRCTDCPARDRCLEWALDRHEVGIWGGTDEDQRRAIRRERRQANAPAPVAVSHIDDRGAA